MDAKKNAFLFMMNFQIFGPTRRTWTWRIKVKYNCHTLPRMKT